jgi:hypothetical protein
MNQGGQKIFPVIVDSECIFKEYSASLLNIYRKFSGIQKYQIFRAVQGDCNIYAFSPSTNQWDTFKILVCYDAF